MKFIRKKLACSFCGKTAAQVGKLVAGPRVYICDACVAEATRIMNEPPKPDVPGPARRQGFFDRIFHLTDSQQPDTFAVSTSASSA